MPSALDRLRDRKQANHRDIPICVDPMLTARQEELNARLAKVKTRLKISSSDDQKLQAEITDLEDELAQLHEEILQASEWIRIKALGPDEYEKLIDEHKPTKDQIREARKLHGPRANIQWNTDTFPNAILVESAFVLTVQSFHPETGNPIFDGTEDPLTEEFVKEMREGGEWSPGEMGMLVSAAININESTTNIGAAGNG